MSLPKVSIVLPTHNGSQYIKSSIDSCLNQTFKDFELVIVDDASTDETPQIVKSYNDPRIKYIRNEKNKRLPQSLNIGFKHACGEYLTWTSDDNLYIPQALAKMLRTLESNRYDFVYADNFIFKDDDLKSAERLHLGDYTELHKSNCIRACFLYSRRVLDKIGEYDPDLELIEDYDFWVRVSKSFYMYHLKEPLYYYRYHNNQLYTARNKEIKVVEFLFKHKYGFMTEDEVIWSMRDLSLDRRLISKVNSLLFKKPKIQRVLKDLTAGKTSFTAARKELTEIVYDLTSIRKKTFVFFRRLPPPPEGEWGGLEKLMFDWFQRIDYTKTKAYVCVTPGWKKRFSDEAAKYNIPINVIEMNWSFNNGMLKRFLNMWTFLKGFKADVLVYFQGHFMEFSIAEIFAGSMRCKGNVFMHENIGSSMPPQKSSKRHFGFLPGLGIWWQINRYLVNLRGRVAKNVLVVSHEIKSRYVSWWKYPKERITVMYHGTDTRKYAPSSEEKMALRLQFNIDPTDIVIITTARFSKMKRLERVIEAFDILNRDFKNLRLLMAGEGPLETELKALADSLSCRDRITFLGHLKETSDYLKASDIFVLSSDNEGLSLALLEAMAAGLICISTDCTGSNEAITNENLGLIVEKSTKGVAEGLKRILSLPKEKQKEISGSAAGYVKNNFDINTNIQKAFKTIGLVN